MPARKTIIVLGSTNTDMVVSGKKIPAPGETVSGSISELCFIIQII